MPTISMFYGILIRMFFDDTNKHHVPHIRASEAFAPLKDKGEFERTHNGKYFG